MDIFFLATNQSVPAYFAQHVGPKGLQMMPFVYENDLSNCEAFVLFSPLYVNGHYVSPDSVWKKYCGQYNPEMKFLTAGFANPSSLNYLELSDLPDNLPRFIKEAKPATDTGWQPANTGGLDMMEILRRFFTGHGNESIMQQFSSLLRIPANIQSALHRKFPHHEIYHRYLSDGDLAGRWQVFLNRWNRYYPFFACLPFYPKFQEIEKLVQKINVFFQSDKGGINLYLQIGCSESIETIKNLLAEIAPHVEGIK